MAGLGGAILAVALVAPASADTTADETQLDGCISAADEADYQQWLCYGAALVVLEDEDGETTSQIEWTDSDAPPPEKFVPGETIAPDETAVPGDELDLPLTSDESSESTTDATASVLTFSTASSRYDARTPSASATFSRVVPNKGGDFYDTWCEYGTICSRKLSSYISETKGNAAYGNGSGVIGSFDVIIRTNLNGRQAQWTITTIWDSGPTLKFLTPTIRCKQKDFWVGTISCGDKSYANFTLTSANYRYTSSIIYGNRLANGGDYWGMWNANFTPSGYPTYNASALTTSVFNCPSGNGNCKFS